VLSLLLRALPREEPGAFFAITFHSLELALPAAATWNQPIVLYAVPREEGVDEKEVTEGA
jgi:hypothetical protein